MPYREPPASTLSALFVDAPIPLTPFTLLPLTLAMSVACRGLELWAIVATSAVTAAAALLSAWSIALWNRRRNAEREWKKQGGTATEFRFALEADHYRFALGLGALFVLALVMYSAVLITHPNEVIPAPPPLR